MSRGAWVRLHRYLGLSCGAFLCLAGVTGSVIVFDHAIDEWLNADMLMASNEGEPASLRAVVEAAASGGRTPLRLVMPRLPGRAYIVEAMQAPGGARPVQVGVDPAGPEVLGVRPAGRHLTAVIYELHHTLLLGRPGEIALGVVAGLVLVSLFSGLYLWWPGWGGLHRALSVKRGASAIRLVFDTHRVCGSYSAIVLVVVVWTGFYLVFSGYIKPLVAAISPLTPVPTDLRSHPDGAGTPITVDEVVAIAGRELPQGEVTLIHLPRGEHGVYYVAVRQPGEVRRSGALSGVAVDRHDGEVLAVVDSKTMTPGDTFLAWQFPLHNGEAFGLPGRVLAFAAGLVPMVVYCTGIVIWWRKRKAREHRERKMRRGLRGGAEPI